jgi:hypothetical protein
MVVAKEEGILRDALQWFEGIYIVLRGVDQLCLVGVVAE